MKSAIAIGAGLLTGLIVAGALLAGFVFVGPDPIRATPTPPGSGAVGSPGGSGSAGPSASAPVVPSGSAAASPGSSNLTENFHVGEPAPALVVPQVGGGSIDLAALKGQPVWLNFMQTTCEPCIDEFPLMNGFAARYGEQGLVVLAVDIREDEGDVAAFASSLNATFPLGLDSDGAAQREWGAFGLPVHYWIDREGIVRDGALGGIGADVMARGVQSIMPGVVVTPD